MTKLIQCYLPWNFEPPSPGIGGSEDTGEQRRKGLLKPHLLFMLMKQGPYCVKLFNESLQEKNRTTYILALGPI